MFESLLNVCLIFRRDLWLMADMSRVSRQFSRGCYKFCVVRRSKIQGLGLYAARTIEKFTMIIEYIGEVVRNEIADVREKRYEAAVSLPLLSVAMYWRRDVFRCRALLLV